MINLCLVVSIQSLGSVLRLEFLEFEIASWLFQLRGNSTWRLQPRGSNLHVPNFDAPTLGLLEVSIGNFNLNLQLEAPTTRWPAIILPAHSAINLKRLQKSNENFWFFFNFCQVIATQFSETKKREMERMRLERARYLRCSLFSLVFSFSRFASCSSFHFLFYFLFYCLFQVLRTKFCFLSCLFCVLFYFSFNCLFLLNQKFWSVSFNCLLVLFLRLPLFLFVASFRLLSSCLFPL